jgi:hypothetical protein
MIVEYTHDDIFLSLGIPFRRTAAQACTLRDFGLCHPDANDFRRFDEQRLRETGSITPTAHVNEGRPRTL